jgi:preprotein translocase subunit YajC
MNIYISNSHCGPRKFCSRRGFINSFLFLLQAVAAPATATTNSNTANAIQSTTEVAAKQSSPYSSIFLLVIMFIIFYFLLIRPNQRKEKKRKEEIAALQEGDKIITSAGIKATIVSIKDDSITIESKGTKLEILKIAVARVIK